MRALVVTDKPKFNPLIAFNTSKNNTDEQQFKNISPKFSNKNSDLDKKAQEYETNIKKYKNDINEYKNYIDKVNIYITRKEAYEKAKKPKRLSTNTNNSFNNKKKEHSKSFEYSLPNPRPLAPMVPKKKENSERGKYSLPNPRLLAPMVPKKDHVFTNSNNEPEEEV